MTTSIDKVIISHIFFICKASCNKVEGFKESFVSLPSKCNLYFFSYNFRFDKILKLNWMFHVSKGKRVPSKFSEGLCCSAFVRPSVFLSVDLNGIKDKMV